MIRADAGRFDHDVELRKCRGIGRSGDEREACRFDGIRRWRHSSLRLRLWRCKKLSALRWKTPAQHGSVARPSRPKPQIATRASARSRPKPHDSDTRRRTDQPARIAAGLAIALAGNVRRTAAASGASASPPRSSCGSDFFGKARDQRVLAPFRPLRQRKHRRARLAPFADAFERLVFAVFEQRIEARRQRGIVEQVAAEDRQQARLGHERRQREKHEMTFRTLPAPAIGRPLAADAEIAVATGKHIVVARAARQMRASRQAPTTAAAARNNPDPRRYATLYTRAGALEIQALAPLVIDLLAVVFERGARTPNVRWKTRSRRSRTGSPRTAGSRN